MLSGDPSFRSTILRPDWKNWMKLQMMRGFTKLPCPKKDIVISPSHVWMTTLDLYNIMMDFYTM